MSCCKPWSNREERVTVTLSAQSEVGTNFWWRAGSVNRNIETGVEGWRKTLSSQTHCKSYVSRVKAEMGRDFSLHLFCCLLRSKQEITRAKGGCDSRVYNISPGNCLKYRSNHIRALHPQHWALHALCVQSRTKSVICTDDATSLRVHI